jgi:hypothetical protein
MVSHHTFNVNPVTQYQLTLDAGAARALASLTGPTITSDKYWYDSGTAITYKGFGAFGRANGFGNRSASWTLDSGTATSLSTTGNFTIAATMTSAHTVHVTIKGQWQVTLNGPAAQFLKSITAPTITNDKYWYDAGTLVSLVLNGTGSRSGGAGQRLVSYSVNSGTSVPIATAGTVTVLNSIAIGGKESVVAVSTTQYQITLDAGAAAAISSISTPSIPGDNYWYDSGTQVTYTGNGVFGRASGTGSRLTGWWWDSTAPTPLLTAGTFTETATMAAPHTLHTQSVRQFEVILTGTGWVSSATNPTVSGDDYWYDSGTVVSLSLQGVFNRTAGTGWRTTSYSINGGPAVPVASGLPVAALSSLTLTSPQTISVQAVRQYQLTFDQGISSALNSVTAPTLGGDDYWFDAGSPMVVTVHGEWGRTSTEGSRLSSYSVNGAPVKTVASSATITVLSLTSISAPQSITSTIATQYLLTVIGGGGATYSVASPIPGDTGWYDSGTEVAVSTNGTYDAVDGVRQRVSSWSIDGGPGTIVGSLPVVTVPGITINAPHSLVFSSVAQYEVTIVVKDNSGSNALSPASILLYVNGGTEAATSGEAWVDSGSTVGVTSVMWHGSDVVPTNPNRLEISSPLAINVNARVYDASIAVKDPLGLAIGGADATVRLANGTTVHTSAGGDGTITLRMIPLGTYQATISAWGLSTSFSGDASVQSSTVASLPLSWAMVFVIVVLVALAIAGIVLVIRNRRQ